MTSSNAFAGALDELPWLRSFAARLARGNEGEAEDLVQETLVAAWQQSPNESPRSPRGWLSTVARNRARLRSRSEIRRRAREAQSGAPAGVEGSDTQLERLRVLRLVVERLEGLPEIDRTIIVRRFFDGLNASEIGEHVGMPAATVRSRLKRSLQRLREELDEHHRGDRAAWSVVVALPLGSVKPEAIAMSQSMKVTAAITTAITLGVGLWLVQRNAETTPADDVSPVALEPAVASPNLPPAPRPSLGSVAPRRVDAEVPSAPMPILAAAESDEDTPLEQAKAARSAASKYCVEEPSMGSVGVFTLRTLIVGDPQRGTTFESFEVLDDRGTDTAFIECMHTELERYSGPAPTEAFRETDTRSTFGPHLSQVAGDRRVQTIFEGVALARLSEIRGCELESGETKGALVLAVTFDGEPAVSRLEIKHSELPPRVAECIVDEVEAWPFPYLTADTFDYTFELPIDPAVDGIVRAPE
ncbi:MAG: sigma-70 family RNA polymerase sigma factor [Myxococcota bacterium]